MANSMRARIRELENQIHAARFAMHKLRDGQYAAAVRSGELGPAEAATRYRIAMANFEDILSGAKNGSYREAIDREMKAYNPGVAMVNALPEPEQEAAE